ncbi:MAG: aconitate hydratase AcnA [Pseudogulbenkiania sp.]|nr:aconitate hydratase AcnA [Pseudogulbenkiania sp.]
MSCLAPPQLLNHLEVQGQRYAYVDLARILAADELARLPYSIRVLLENVARRSPEALPPFLARVRGEGPDCPACEVPFYPNRLMLHDTTCLPAMADLAGMRDAVAELGGDPAALNPTIPVVLTIDHSVIVERYAKPDAIEVNLDIDYRRNTERYRFIKWAQRSVANFRVVPPGTGIIHQVNMESLGQVVWQGQTADGEPLLHPDDMVATDSHTPMINAIGILGWGVGGLEGQAAMLGEPVPIVFPEVVGVRVTGALRPGVTATDLALHLTELLRRRGVVNKFVEFCGQGLDTLDWGARGTIANMAPEYGATVVYFPFDDITLDYLRLTGRSAEHCERVVTYLQAQRLYRDKGAAEPVFDAVIELDLATVAPCMAGPYLPHQRQPLAGVPQSFCDEVVKRHARDLQARFDEPDFGEPITHGAVVLAAITSCTNTANPYLMLQAGLLARNARRRGLKVKPWVKTSLSPGSRVVSDYLQAAGLMPDLEALGFHVVGFGCMTCIGSSGALEPHVEKMVDEGLLSAGVLSGNRNFEGRVNPKLAGGYLASPPLVVAYAIAGSVMNDIETTPLGQDEAGRPVYLRDIWPSDEEVAARVKESVRADFFTERAKTLWAGTHHWQQLSAEGSVRFGWDERSTYLRRPRYTEQIPPQQAGELSIHDARAFLVFGDNITTDHISPVGTIPRDSAAGHWLLERGEAVEDLNQYSTRRSNHEVMLRGAFTTRNLRNRLLGEANPPDGARAWNADCSAVLPVYQAAHSYAEAGTPLVVFAGVNYGAGSSRDWAAKAQALLGVRAVVAKSFERIHRSNLIGMGVLPLEFLPGDGIDAYALCGDEQLHFSGLDPLAVGSNPVELHIVRADGTATAIALRLRIDSRQELEYLRHGGILPYVLRKQLTTSQA